MSYPIEALKGQKTYTWSQCLPSHPFKMLMVGKSPAGKTTVLISMLNKKFPFANFFKNNIFVMCPTIRDDKRWGPVLKRLKIEKEFISETWDDDFISEKVKKHVDEHRLPTLLVIDDMIPIPGPRKNRTVFTSVFTRGRHWGNDAGLSIITTTQFLRALDPIIRSNASNILLWFNSDKETLKAYEENASGLSKKDWYELFLHAVRQKYSFFHINYGAPSLEEGRFCLRFEKIIVPDSFKVHEEEVPENEDNLDEPEGKNEENEY